MTTKSVVVYGPPGCGKTFNADRIRRKLGLDRVVDNWNGNLASLPTPLFGDLILTAFEPPKGCPCEVMTFHDAMIKVVS